MIDKASTVPPCCTGQSQIDVYPHYFGLREASFSITPDPQYLFLSEQHREALAHLLYGASGNGGFVLLTGEVGTGKTTVCRAFLEQLPPGVEVALVLNPALTAIELMHAVCDEFRLPVPAGETSAKALLDRLNDYLLAAHADGRHPVLIIDEAQNLRPKVLEQVRLLTNLETNKAKLLQIFLIGQPELRAMLASPDLRQLNQRITARFHLRPLDARATCAYIEHRISVAGVDRPLFTPRALRAVHRHAGGVPRLINLICDRALLGAAVGRRLQVTPDIVHRAAREIHGRDGRPARTGPMLRGLALAASLLLAVGLGVWLGASGHLATLAPGLAARLPAAAPLTDVPTSAMTTAAAIPPPVTVAAAAERSPTLAAGAASPAAASPPPVDAPPAAGDPASVAQSTADAEPAPSAQSAAMPAVDPAPVAQSTADAEPALVAHQAAATPTPTPTEEPATAVIAALPLPPASALATTAAVATPAVPPATEAAPDTPRISLARLTTAVRDADATALPELTVTAAGAVPALLRHWGHLVTDPVGCAGLASYGLACERSSGRWHDLRRFDRPAALRLLVDGRSRYAIVSALDEEFAVIDQAGQAYRLPVATLDERWSGEFLLLWQPPVDGVRHIGAGATGQAVQWLRERLAALPGAGIERTGPDRYDAALGAAVRRFQSEQGLRVDGVAGPHTLILLDNVLAAADVPRLGQSR